MVSLTPRLELSFYARAVNENLGRLFPFQGPEIYGLARQAVVHGGKRVRATLALLSCEAVCGDYRPALPLAIAYELAHSAALIQDDIIDGALTRRRMKSVWAEHGIAKALLSMDIVLFSIPRILGVYAKKNLPGSRLDTLLRMLGNSLRNASLGEFLHLELSRKEVVSLNEYLKMVKLKTGSLLAAPSACGALVGLGTKKEVRALYRFGETLGAAYQVTDDVLDVMGNPSETGKPRFNDTKNGKKNIVTILSLEELKKRQNKAKREFVKSLFGRSPSDQEILQARKIFTETLALRRAKALAAELVEKANSALAELRDAEGKKKLLQLSQLLARRSE